MKDLTALKIVLWIVALCSFIGSVWLTSETLEGNTAPLYGFLALLLVLVFLFGLRDRCWLILPFCMGMQGNLNFLPIRFSMLELATLGCLASTTLFYIMGDRRKITLGPMLHRIPLLIICSIALIHWVKTGNIGLRMFGSETVGARPIFTILVAGISYLLIHYLARNDSKDLRLVPWLYLGGATIDFVSQGITFLMPGLAVPIYRFYSNVNTEAYFYMMGGDMQGGIVRFGAINHFVLALALALVAQFPPPTWLKPSRMWVPLMLLGCLLGSIYGGFRSGLATLAVHISAACFATTRAFVLVLGILAIGFCAALAQMHGKVFDLPLSMQRTLSFFPGDWDSRITISSAGSNEFRLKVIDLYLREYAMANMLIGSGWAIPKEFVQEAEEAWWQKVPTADPDAEIRRVIELRNEHWGWINAHHTTGLLGLVSLAILTVGSLVWMLRRLSRLPVAMISPPMVWGFSILFYQGIVFLFMGQPLRDCLPVISVVVALMGVLFEEIDRSLATPQPRAFAWGRASRTPEVAPAWK